MLRCRSRLRGLWGLWGNGQKLQLEVELELNRNGTGALLSFNRWYSEPSIAFEFYFQCPFCRFVIGWDREAVPGRGLSDSEWQREVGEESRVPERWLRWKKLER